MFGKMRLESDSIGTMEVPEEAYYGVQTLRAKENFAITGNKMHPVFIKELAKVKKACAITNRNAGSLELELAEAIIRACDEVIRGRFSEEFIVDAIQGGAGTSANMNMNEVLAKHMPINLPANQKSTSVSTSKKIRNMPKRFGKTLNQSPTSGSGSRLFS